MSSVTEVFPKNMIRICIDGYGNDFSGRIYSKMMPVSLPFSGCGGLLLGMDDLFDRIGYPQAFQVKRTFLGPEKPEESRRIQKQMMEDKEINRQRGNFRTFDIVVQSRRQSCCQGILMNPGRTLVKKFESDMELLNCICRDLEHSG